jgi:hypothetical protein
MIVKRHAVLIYCALSQIILSIGLPGWSSSIRIGEKVPAFNSPAHPDSTTVSADAMQLAEILGLTDKFKHLQELKEKLPQRRTDESNIELRQELTEGKIEIIEALEQARLDVDFVFAEIETEQAIAEEVLQAYTTERDHRINNANIQAFRVNGALWAVAEALTIPTYKLPRYSIPSGTIGILAGIVPSAFSLYAIRSTPGRRYQREASPNILSKLFDYPASPNIEYPESVWRYLNATPAVTIAGLSGNRLQLLKNHWFDDPNIGILAHNPGTKELDLVTGKNQDHETIELLTSRLIMFREIKAIVCGMNRSLRELSMVERGTKYF